MQIGSRLKLARILIVFGAIVIVGVIVVAALARQDNELSPLNEFSSVPHMVRAQPETCGNGICDRGENGLNCRKDCGDICGDGYCTGIETCATCPDDCKCPIEPTPSKECGDGVCSPGEACDECPEDCECSTPNPEPDSGSDPGSEPAQSLPSDSGQPAAVCGDGTCNGDEACGTCIPDCGMCVPLPTLPNDGLCSIAANGPYVVNVRRWPAEDTAIIEQLAYEQTYTAIGLSRDRQWFQLADDGWVASWVVRSDGECDSLPDMAFDTADPPDDLSLKVIDECDQSTDDLAKLTVSMVSNILASPDSCVTFERSLLVLAHPEYDNYWANVYGGPFGQELDPNPIMTSVTGVGAGQMAAEANCENDWEYLQNNHSEISLGHLNYFFWKQWSGGDICAEIQLFIDDGGVPTHKRDQQHWLKNNLLPSCAERDPATLDADDIPPPGVDHQDWPFIWYGGDENHIEAPYLAQPMSWLDKVAGLDRPTNELCNEYTVPPPPCETLLPPVITSPTDNTITSGRPTLTWEYNDDCIIDAFHVIVLDESCTGTVDPPMIVALPHTARSWTVENQLECDGVYSLSVFPMLNNAPASQGDFASIQVSSDDDCAAPPPDENPDPDDPDQPSDDNPADPRPEEEINQDPNSNTQMQGGYQRAREDSSSFGDAIGDVFDFLTGAASGGSTADTNGNPTNGDPPAVNEPLDSWFDPPPSNSDMGNYDNDAVPDDTDQCPAVAGPAAWSGCPAPPPNTDVDSDGDGVNYPFDRCWYEVGPTENDGCPVDDYDNDSVPDDEDACPNYYGSVTWNGCPDPGSDEATAAGDIDGDRWADGIDDCPDQPGPMENNGCPMVWLWDYDGDGVDDSADECPAIPGLASLQGCPQSSQWDMDGDGLINSEDDCPAIPGDPYDWGCPPNGTDYDWDQDGVPNFQDYCPSVVGNNPATGCPVPNATDSDGDGVLNSIDECHGLWGTISTNGCPSSIDFDLDSDGVPDALDLCPTIYGNTSYGCPVSQPYDSDGDGYYDDEDLCPNVPGGYDDGCPLVPAEGSFDSDGDGVYDYLDYCPTLYGIDPYGCPLPLEGSDLPDADSDGLPDDIDPCPLEPGSPETGYDCAEWGNTDSDGDGIANASDICPNNWGTAINGGCPPPPGSGG